MRSRKKKNKKNEIKSFETNHLEKNDNDFEKYELENLDA